MKLIGGKYKHIEEGLYFIFYAAKRTNVDFVYPIVDLHY